MHTVLCHGWGLTCHEKWCVCKWLQDGTVVWLGARSFMHSRWYTDDAGSHAGVDMTSYFVVFVYKWLDAASHPPTHLDQHVLCIARCGVDGVRHLAAVEDAGGMEGQAGAGVDVQ